MNRQQGVVAVIPDQSRLLVVRRSLQVRAPGKYCFPGGARETGETEAAAVEREVREEVGLAVVPGRRLWSSSTPSGVQLAWWLAVLPEPQVLRPDPAEVQQALWLTPRQIRALTDLLITNHQFLDAWEAGEFELPGGLKMEG